MMCKKYKVPVMHWKIEFTIYLTVDRVLIIHYDNIPKITSINFFSIFHYLIVYMFALGVSLIYKESPLTINTMCLRFYQMHISRTLWNKKLNISCTYYGVIGVQDELWITKFLGFSFKKDGKLSNQKLTAP
jgi:hypothetical protein